MTKKPTSKTRKADKPSPKSAARSSTVQKVTPKAATDKSEEAVKASGVDASLSPAQAVSSPGSADIKPTEPTPPSVAASRSASPADGSSTVFGAFIAVVILGLISAGAWVFRDHWWAYVAPLLPQHAESTELMARVSAIEDHIASHVLEEEGDSQNVVFAELQQESDNLTAELSTVMARLEAVEDSLAGVERLANAAASDDAANAAREAVRALADRLSTLEAVGIAGSEISTESSAQFDNVLERLRTVEDQTRAMESAAVDDTAALASVRSRIDDIASMRVAPSDNASAAALVLSVGQLRAAVRRGAPYEEDMKLVSSSVGDLAEATPYLQVLRDHAVSGVPTVLQLQQSFGDVADAAFDANEPSRDDGWLSQTLHRLKSIVRIRDTDASVKSGSVESSIARAETSLSAGDLAGAAQVLSGLDGAAAVALSDWLAGAQARLDVDDALTILHSLAISRMIAGPAIVGQE